MPPALYTERQNWSSAAVLEASAWLHQLYHPCVFLFDPYLHFSGHDVYLNSYRRTGSDWDKKRERHDQCRMLIVRGSNWFFPHCPWWMCWQRRQQALSILGFVPPQNFTHAKQPDWWAISLKGTVGKALEVGHYIGVYHAHMCFMPWVKL